MKSLFVPAIWLLLGFVAEAQVTVNCFQQCQLAVAVNNAAAISCVGNPSPTLCFCNQPALATSIGCCAATRCTNSYDLSLALSQAQSDCHREGATFTPAAIVCPTTTLLQTYLTTAAGSSSKASTGGSPQTGAGTATATSNPSPVLTGTCSIPSFTSTVAAGTTTQFALLGCSPNQLDCCAYNINLGGQLSSCPAGYATVGSTACCPAGWSTTSTNLGNFVPCVTNPAFDLTPPLANTTGTEVVITKLLFAIPYSLKPETSSSSGDGLSTGAKIGIGVAIPLVVIIIGVAVGIILWKRRANASNRKTASDMPPPTTGAATTEHKIESKHPEIDGNMVTPSPGPTISPPNTTSPIHNPAQGYNVSPVYNPTNAYAEAYGSHPQYEAHGVPVSEVSGHVQPRYELQGHEHR